MLARMKAATLRLAQPQPPSDGLGIGDVLAVGVLFAILFIGLAMPFGH